MLFNIILCIYYIIEDAFIHCLYRTYLFIYLLTYFVMSTQGEKVQYILLCLFNQIQ